MIEYRRRRAYLQQMMLWDGTADTAAAIKAWVGDRPDGSSGFLLPDEITGVAAHALLWVDHNNDWVALPVGHRVVAELDGSGFYPISLPGLRVGFDPEPVQCTCPNGRLHPQNVGVSPTCALHNAPKPPPPATVPA